MSQPLLAYGWRESLTQPMLVFVWEVSDMPYAGFQGVSLPFPMMIYVCGVSLTHPMLLYVWGMSFTRNHFTVTP